MTVFTTAFQDVAQLSVLYIDMIATNENLPWSDPKVYAVAIEDAMETLIKDADGLQEVVDSLPNKDLTHFRELADFNGWDTNEIVEDLVWQNVHEWLMSESVI
jgi:hypothetical protein